MSGLTSLREESGWTGVFTRDHAEGALENGSYIVKQNAEPGDATPEGEYGTVLGSIEAPSEVTEAAGFADVKYVYFVEWNHSPQKAVAVMDRKVRIY